MRSPSSGSDRVAFAELGDEARIESRGSRSPCGPSSRRSAPRTGPCADSPRRRRPAARARARLRRGRCASGSPAARAAWRRSARSWSQVLQHAAGADAEMRAARHDAIRRGLEHLERLAPRRNGGCGRSGCARTRLAGQARRRRTRPCPRARPTPRPSWQQVVDREFEFAVELGTGSGHARTAMKRAADCLKSAAPRSTPVRGLTSASRRRRVLVPPARVRAGDPLPGEGFADLLFPFRMAVGDRDLAIHRLAVAVVLGHQLVDARRGPSARPSLASRTTTRPSLPKPSAPLSKCASSDPWKRAAMRVLDRLDRRRADGDVHRPAPARR